MGWTVQINWSLIVCNFLDSHLLDAVHVCVRVCSISTVWYVYIKWMCDFTLKQFEVALKQPIINNTVVSVGNFFIVFSVSACSYFWTCVLFFMRYHLLAANQFTDPSCFVRLTLKIHESGRKKRYYRCFSLQPTTKKTDGKRNKAELKEKRTLRNHGWQASNRRGHPYWCYYYNSNNNRIYIC